MNQQEPRRQSTLPRLSFGATSVVLVGLLMLLWAPRVSGQPAELARGMEAYEFGDNQKAIEMLSVVAEDASVATGYRQEALRYIGRAYLVEEKKAQVREAMRSLVELEPPLVELDPDREPPPIMDAYYEVRQQKQGSYVVENRDPGLQTLAVMDFTNASVDERGRYDGLTKGFPSMMINNLNGATELQVIERERVQWLLDELQLQRSGTVDQSTAVRTGKVLGATAVLFGSYIVHDEEMWISARLVKVETGEILLAEKITGEPSSFFELVDDLSLQVTRSINVEMEETELGSSTETQSIEAMMAYGDGLKALENEDYRQAYEKFLEAQEYDPTYERAARKAASLEPMLAARGAGTGAEGDS